MKKLLTLLLLIGLYSCSTSPATPAPNQAPEKVPIYSQQKMCKVVKGKVQESKIEQDRKYSLYNDQFYNESYTVVKYYLAYTDKSTEEIDARTYALYDKGDTIWKTITYISGYK